MLLRPRSTVYYMKNISGVICYKEGDQCYVYSPQLKGEALLENGAGGLDVGQWIEFNA